MKKIISIFCTLAMVLSMAFTVSADENNYIKFEKVDSAAGTVVFDAILVTSERVASVSATWNVLDALNKGVTAMSYEVLKSGASANANKSKKAIMVSYTSAIEPITGEVALARFTFTGNVTEDLSLPCTKSYCTALDADDNNIDVDMTVPTTLKVVEEEEVPEVKTTVSEKAAVSNPTEAKTVGVLAESPEGLIFNKLSVILNNGSVDSDPVVIYDGVSIDAPTAFGLNIMQVPAGVTITVTDVVAE